MSQRTNVHPGGGIRCIAIAGGERVLDVHRDLRKGAKWGGQVCKSSTVHGRAFSSTMRCSWPEPLVDGGRLISFSSLPTWYRSGPQPEVLMVNVSGLVGLAAAKSTGVPTGT